VAREAFVDLPTGCPTLGFDIDITPTGFTMCTVPDVAVATQMPMTFHIDVPDLVIPPFCPCIPTQSFSRDDYQVAVSTQKAGLYFTMQPNTANPDCCEPDFTMQFDLVVPCMPLAVTNIGTYTVTSVGQGAMTMWLDKAEQTCVLQLNYNLEMPCLPFTLHATGNVTHEAAPSTGASTLYLTKSADCTLQLNYDLHLPCFPFDVGATGTVKYDPVHVGDSTIYLSRASACTLLLNYDLNLPCSPVAVGVVTNGAVPDYAGVKETVFLTMYMATYCTMKFGIKLSRTGLTTGITYARGLRWTDNCLQWRYGIQYYKDGRCYSIYDSPTYIDLICATYC
jgi:hypothetical protein